MALKDKRRCRHLHPEPMPDLCAICNLFVTHPGYRARWTSEKLDPVVSEAVRTKRAAKQISLAVCEYRGEELTGEQRQQVGLPHGKKWYRCGKGKHFPKKNKHRVPGIVCPCEGCGPTCDSFKPGESLILPRNIPHAKRHQPTPTPSAMVAIGHYGLPGVVELQAKMIRKHCGESTPILVSDDHTEQAHHPHEPPTVGWAKKARLLDVVQKCGLIYRDTASTRCGHAGGDLGPFYHGLTYAKANGLAYVVKLSQRFLLDIPDWLARLSVMLAERKLPTMSRPCTYGSRRVFHLRSEFVLMEVERWSQVVEQFKPRPLNGEAAESLVWRTVATGVGKGMLGSPFFGNDRQAVYPGIIWKDVEPADVRSQHYADVFNRYQVDPGPEWHCGPSLAFPNHRW